MSKKNILIKFLAIFISCTVFISGINYTVFCNNQAQFINVVNRQIPQTMSSLKPLITNKNINIPLLRGLNFDATKPNHIGFYLDNPNNKKIAALDLHRMIKYFLGFLAIKQSDIWVNLSPYEEDRIIPNTLEKLDIGKDFLIEDYILKRLTSYITSPKIKEAKRFWQEVNKAAFLMTRNNKLPIDTFQKIWIVPNDIEICQNGNKALITKATLKVMLEEDFLESSGQRIAYRKEKSRKYSSPPINAKIKEIFKSELLPIIEKEVNEGITFAPLRQLYYAFILATYFKDKFANKGSYDQYVNQEKTEPIVIREEKVKKIVYQQYLKNFHQGEYRLLENNFDLYSGKKQLRKYFSGGFNFTQELNSRKTELSDEQFTKKLEETTPLELETSTKAFAALEQPKNKIEKYYSLPLDIWFYGFLEMLAKTWDYFFNKPKSPYRDIYLEDKFDSRLNQLNQLQPDFEQLYPELPPQDLKIDDKYKHIQIVENARRIFHIGDIHGYFFGLIDSFVKLGFISEEKVKAILGDKKIYGYGFIRNVYRGISFSLLESKVKPKEKRELLAKLVQEIQLVKGDVITFSGDLIDRWPNSIEVIEFLMLLQKRADSLGAKVIINMGNHDYGLFTLFKFIQGIGRKDRYFIRKIKDLFFYQSQNLNPLHVTDMLHTIDYLFTQYNGYDGLKIAGIVDFISSLPMLTMVDNVLFSHSLLPFRMSEEEKDKIKSLTDFDNYLENKCYLAYVSDRQISLTKKNEILKKYTWNNFDGAFQYYFTDRIDEDSRYDNFKKYFYNIIYQATGINPKLMVNGHEPHEMGLFDNHELLTHDTAINPYYREIAGYPITIIGIIPNKGEVYYREYTALFLDTSKSPWKRVKKMIDYSAEKTLPADQDDAQYLDIDLEANILTKRYILNYENKSLKDIEELVIGIEHNKPKHQKAIIYAFKTFWARQLNSPVKESKEQIIKIKQEFIKLLRTFASNQEIFDDLIIVLTDLSKEGSLLTQDTETIVQILSSGLKDEQKDKLVEQILTKQINKPQISNSLNIKIIANSSNAQGSFKELNLTAIEHRVKQGQALTDKEKLELLTIAEKETVFTKRILALILDEKLNWIFSGEKNEIEDSLNKLSSLDIDYNLLKEDQVISLLNRVEASPDDIGVTILSYISGYITNSDKYSDKYRDLLVMLACKSQENIKKSAFYILTQLVGKRDFIIPNIELLLNLLEKESDPGIKDTIKKIIITQWAKEAILPQWQIDKVISYLTHASVCQEAYEIIEVLAANNKLDSSKIKKAVTTIIDNLDFLIKTLKLKMSNKQTNQKELNLSMINYLSNILLMKANKQTQIELINIYIDMVVGVNDLTKEQIALLNSIIDEYLIINKGNLKDLGIFSKLVDLLKGKEVAKKTSSKDSLKGTKQQREKKITKSDINLIDPDKLWVLVDKLANHLLDELKETDIDDILKLNLFKQDSSERGNFKYEILDRLILKAIRILSQDQIAFITDLAKTPYDNDDEGKRITDKCLEIIIAYINLPNRQLSVKEVNTLLGLLSSTPGVIKEIIKILNQIMNGVNVINYLRQLVTLLTSSDNRIRTFSLTNLQKINRIESLEGYIDELVNIIFTDSNPESKKNILELIKNYYQQEGKISEISLLNIIKLLNYELLNNDVNNIFSIAINRREISQEHISYLLSLINTTKNETAKNSAIALIRSILAENMMSNFGNQDIDTFIILAMTNKIDLKEKNKVITLIKDKVGISQLLPSQINKIIKLCFDNDEKMKKLALAIIQQGLDEEKNKQKMIEIVMSNISLLLALLEDVSPKVQESETFNRLTTILTLIIDQKGFIANNIKRIISLLSWSNISKENKRELLITLGYSNFSDPNLIEEGLNLLENDRIDIGLRNGFLTLIMNNRNWQDLSKWHSKLDKIILNLIYESINSPSDMNISSSLTKFLLGQNKQDLLATAFKNITLNNLEKYLKNLKLNDSYWSQDKKEIISDLLFKLCKESLTPRDIRKIIEKFFPEAVEEALVIPIVQQWFREKNLEQLKQHLISIKPRVRELVAEKLINLCKSDERVAQEIIKIFQRLRGYSDIKVQELAQRSIDSIYNGKKHSILSRIKSYSNYILGKREYKDVKPKKLPLDIFASTDEIKLPISTKGGIYWGKDLTNVKITQEKTYNNLVPTNDLKTNKVNNNFNGLYYQITVNGKVV